MPTGSARRHGNRVDLAMVAVVRLATDAALTPAVAALRLREQVPDLAVLRAARARVSAALVGVPGAIGARALATLDAALAALDDADEADEADEADDERSAS
ncbi:MAG TPA: hypothetical protein VNS55_15940 [Nocardioides sp.]|nr:hypothetical protein [Nocardioides sp.]